MKYNPAIHHRRSIRLRGYDYSQSGAYYLTICTYKRKCIFGEIVDGTMVSNECGKILDYCWSDLPNHYHHIKLANHVIMPNHFHGIVIISVGAGYKPAPTETEPAPTDPQTTHALPEIVRGLKTFSARRINEYRNTPGIPVWQRNYYEHIIRDEESLARISKYIVENPARWGKDINYGK